MAKHSTNKSVTKRLKITRNSKIVRRPMGVNHFKTKRTSNQLRDKRSSRSLDYPLKKLLNY